jgi:DNA polymerase I-like protein with 3'-5' exonuclease and polymerase domains
MEVGVGAQLSGDSNLLAAYDSGDAHMTLAKQGGMVPQDASKSASKSPYACGKDCGGNDCKRLPACAEFAEHCDVRAQCKTCNLAAMYGAIVQTLMDKGLTRAQASRALKHHHQVYSVFWDWIEDRIEESDVNGEATTADGWVIKVDAEAKGFNPRSVGNFFVQANSAAIMRLAAILATERGLGICAVVHDAFLLECSIEDMPKHVASLKECMDEASAVILDGFVLGVDGWKPDDWIVYPDRYMDERGKDFWKEVETALQTLVSNEPELQLST